MTLDTTSLFETGYFSDDEFQEFGSFGAEKYSIVYPPNPAYPPSPANLLLPAVQINWGNSIVWQFRAGPSQRRSRPTLSPPAVRVSRSLRIRAWRRQSRSTWLEVSRRSTYRAASSPSIPRFRSEPGRSRVSEVPEPSSLVLLGVGLASLPAFRRWRAAPRGATPPQPHIP